MKIPLTIDNLKKYTMKTLFRTAVIIVLFTTIFSCKKNETTTEDNYSTEPDTTSMNVDSIGPNSDTTTVDVSKTGTTGATGEGSTGSGSAGTVQKGNTNVKTDSTSNK